MDNLSIPQMGRFLKAACIRVDIIEQMQNPPLTSPGMQVIVMPGRKKDHSISYSTGSPLQQTCTSK